MSLDRHVRWYLGASALVLVAYWFLPHAAAGVTYDAFGALATTAVLWGTRRRPKGDRTSWYLIGIGLAAWTLADALWTSVDLASASVPFPSFIDALYMSAYPCWFAAFLLFAYRRRGRRDLTVLFDALIMMSAAGIVSWFVIIRPEVAATSLPVTSIVVTVFYPTMDVLLLAVLVRLLLSPSTDRRLILLLMTGLSTSLVADHLYSVAALNGTYRTQGWIDAGWLLVYATWGVAGLLPDRSARVHAEVREPTWAALLSFAVAVAAFPVVYVIVGFDSDRAGMIVVVVASAPVFVLIGARLAATIRRSDAARAEAEEHHDQLETAVEKLRELEQHRADLLDRTVRAAEEERARIAVDLHDGPIQHLTALSLRFGLARARLRHGDPVAADDVLASAENELGDDIAELRRLMSDLRPPALDEGGLQGALRDHCDVVAARTGGEVRFDYEFRAAIPHDVEIVLYRIAQEALSNVARHAHARSTDVRVAQCDRGVSLTVRDNGAGFDASADDAFTRDGHFGLAGMAQRAKMVGGSLHVESVRGAGTIVAVEVPIGVAA